MTRGDIVILDVPFPDKTGTKVRPGLVVQADQYNRLISTVIAAITSSKNRMVGAKTQLFIDISTVDGRGTGLRTDSVIQCNHLVTVDKSLIHKTIGRLSATQIQLIDLALKESLGLS